MTKKDFDRLEIGSVVCLEKCDIFEGVVIGKGERTIDGYNYDALLVNFTGYGIFNSAKLILANDLQVVRFAEKQSAEQIKAFEARIKRAIDELEDTPTIFHMRTKNQELDVITFNTDGTLEISDELAFAIVKKLRLCSIKGE